MKWSARFATGIERLDTQHRQLFRMSEDYGLALAEGRGENAYALMLRLLDRYAQAHFDFEESCMFRHRCPAGAANSAAHGEFIAAVAAFRERYERDGFDADDAARLVRFVDDWLADHIGRIDVQLRPLVESA